MIAPSDVPTARRWVFMWKSTVGKLQMWGRQIDEKDSLYETVRLNDMDENLRGSVDGGFAVVGRIWVKGFNHSFDQTWKIRLDHQRALR